MQVNNNDDGFIREITKRYGNIDRLALKDVLCPILIPLHTIDKAIKRVSGQKHYRASFSIKIDDTNRQLMQKGRTGKFVPKQYFEGGPWKEIAKGRILELDHKRDLTRKRLSNHNCRV